MDTNELVATLRERNIQTPDELSCVIKWDILMLLIPGLTQEKVKNQKKNYAKLKVDSMLYRCIDTICQLFIDMVYLDARPDMPNDRISLRSFKHMIRMRVNEVEEVQTELDCKKITILL